jgi:hypothetical protein
MESGEGDQTNLIKNYNQIDLDSPIVVDSKDEKTGDSKKGDKKESTLRDHISEEQGGKVNYTLVESSWWNRFKKSIPKAMHPTKKSGYIFGALFLLAVIITLVTFPYGSMLAGNVDITVSVGFPLPFLEFDLVNPEALPLRFTGLIVDILVYLVLSYLLDIAINYLFEIKLLKSKEEKDRIPEVVDVGSTLQQELLEKDKLRNTRGDDSSIQES